MENKKQIIDFHGMHLLSYEPYHLSIGDLDKSLSLSCTTKDCFEQIKSFRKGDNGKVGILPYTYGKFYKRNEESLSFENEQMYRLLHFLDAHGLGSAVLPFLAISNNPENRRNLEKILKSSLIYGNKKGFKFHGTAMQIPPSSLLNSETLSLLEELKVPLIVHSGKDYFSNPLQIYPLASAYPKISFVAAHLGALNEEFLKRIDDYENVYTDTSILSDLLKRLQNECNVGLIEDLSPEERIMGLIKRFKLSKRIIFGSDYPWTNIFNTSPKRERELLFNLKIPEEIRDDWSFKTAEKILNKQ